MRYGLLGPLEVQGDDGERVALGGLRQRALLAILLLRANEVVSTERLVNDLWGEGAPPQGAHTVQVFVSRLRKTLAPAGGRLETHAPGYMLVLDDEDDVDANRCERLYAEGRALLKAGDAEGAAKVLRDAEALWRGPPLVEFAYDVFAQAPIARLEQLRSACREERLEADLAAGRHHDVLGELEELARNDPYAERPRMLLMLALFRCGRHAEALDAYQDARRTLVDELGLEPSAELRELQDRILRQDPTLGWAAPAAPMPPAEPEADLPRAAPELTTGDRDGGPAPRAPAAVAAGRRTVTMLVCELKVVKPERGLDPEGTRVIRSRAASEIAAIVKRVGGMTHQVHGREVIASFGLPRSHEDDSMRAMRAACQANARLAEVARELERDWGAGLRARFGIDTGEMLVAADHNGEPPVGDPYDNAFALARAAGFGEVLIGSATRELARAAVRVERVEECETDVPCWRLVELLDPSVIPQQTTTPMVGREAEMATLEKVFDLAISTRSCQLVTVIGDAGLGKSRLAAEFTSAVAQDATILTGRCLSYGEGITYWPLRELVGQAAGSESPEAIRDVLAGEPNADEVSRVLAATLGLSDDAVDGEQVLWAFRRFIEHLAGRRPLVMVIEDAHWAEPPLLDLLEDLADWITGAPVLLLCLARPELLEARPGWGAAGANATSLVLRPLEQGDTGRLIDSYVTDGPLAAEDRSRIVATAEGNPFFLEQILAMRAEGGSMHPEPAVPASIQAILAARLDRLGPAERSVIERAAVIGREFWQPAVVELLPEDLRPSAGGHVRTLVRRGLVRPDRTTIQGLDALRFNHILIREAAYRSVSKAVRSDLHERFADWLERRGEQYEEIIGYHLEQAHRWHMEVAPPDEHSRVLADRAADRLGHAGERALARADAPGAVSLLGRALDMLSPDDHRRPGLLASFATALIESGDFDRAERVLDDAIAAADTAGDPTAYWRAELERHWFAYLKGGGVANLEIAERAVPDLEKLGDVAGLARAWNLAGFFRFHSGRLAAATEAWEQALVHWRDTGRSNEQSDTLCWMLIALSAGDTPAAEALARIDVVRDARPEDRRIQAYALIERGVLLAMRGDFEQARSSVKSGRAMLRDIGLTMLAATSCHEAFAVEMMANDPAEAAKEVRCASEELERMGERTFLASTLPRLARAESALGHFDVALRLVEDSEALAPADDVDAIIQAGLARAEVLTGLGSYDDANAAAREALRRAEETDFVTWQADALGALADALAAAGRGDEARETHVRAQERYARKGNVVGEARMRARRKTLG